MIDCLKRLRHNPVVGGNNQNHNIRHLRTAGAHAGERLVTRRIDEDDLAIVLLDVVRADVLRNAAGFPSGHVGLTDCVKQRSLSVIDVAHDRDHGRAADEIGGFLGLFDILRALLFVADLVRRRTELARQLLGEFDVESLIDRRENLLRFDQLFDHEVGFDA